MHGDLETGSPRRVDTRDRVHAGLRWVGLSLVVTRAIRFATNIALAWLLAKEAFGVLALALAASAMLGALREVGFGQAYIQRVDRDAEDSARAADTTFVITAGLNVALFVCAQLATPWLARYFGGIVGLEPVLRAMFCVFLVDVFTTTPLYLLQKRMEFGRHAAGEISAGLVTTVVSLTLAFSGFGVWSLVAGHLSGQLVYAAMLTRLARWRPRVRFDSAIARELMHFGKWMWAFALLSAVGGVLDRVVIGKASGAADLGAYVMALNLCNLLATNISSLVNRVAFPALARVQDDRAALQRGFVKAVSHVAFLTLPLTVGLYAVAGDLVRVGLPERWNDAIPLIRILVFYSAVLALSSPAGPILKAVGKPQTLVYSSLVHHAVLFVAMFQLAPLGARGVAWALVIPMSVSAVLSFGLVRYYVKLDLGRVFGPLLRTGVAAGLMFAAVTALGGWLGPARDAAEAWILAARVGVGIAAYMVANALFNRALTFDMLETAMRVAPGWRRAGA